MSQIQQSLNYKHLYSLTKPTQPSSFQNKKTHQLYSALANLQPKINQAQMIAAQQQTILKNRSKIVKPERILNIQAEAYAISGVTLRQNSNNVNFNRNRTYSIVKTSEQRKKTLTERDFERIYTKTVKTKQIIYQYDSKTLVPHLTPLKIDSNRQKQNDLHSAASTIQDNCDHAKDYSNKVKPYKFVKLKKGAKTCRTKNEPYNIFNVIDRCFNSKGYQKDFHLGHIQLISKSIKHRQ